jgi:hypothetical protein
MTDPTSDAPAGPQRLLRVTVQVLEEVPFYAPAIISEATEDVPLAEGADIGQRTLGSIAKSAAGAALSDVPKRALSDEAKAPAEEQVAKDAASK